LAYLNAALVGGQFEHPRSVLTWGQIAESEWAFLVLVYLNSAAHYGQFSRLDYHGGQQRTSLALMGQKRDGGCD
jgi:hypothetical protein